MHLISHKKAKLLTLKARGAEYLSIQKHELGGVPAGTVLGWHKTHEAACRRAGANTFATVKDINDAISDANE